MHHEILLNTANLKLVVSEVEGKLVIVNFLDFFSSGVSTAAKDSLDSCHDFFGVKGLYRIVIGTELET